MIGQVVNYRYEILEKAGDGTFFTVYKARDKVLNRLVALKTLKEPASENKDFAERMLAETQRVENLVHPHIARVYDADSHNGTYYTAVEYVRGINLKDRIRRTAPFTVSYAIDIAIAIAEALDYAHREGVVHGDVRPHNVMTSSEGEIKLTDFAAQSAVSAFPTLKDNSMLRSVHYTAPEVLKGQIPQPASDVYSLGTVIYEMVTGTVPFDGDSAIAIAAKHLQETPAAPSRINQSVPKLLDDVILRAMAKEPQSRYSSMADVLRDLYAIRDSFTAGMAKTGAAAPPPLVLEDEEEDEEVEERNLRSTILTLLAIFFVVTALGVVIAYLFLGKRPSQLGVPDFTGMTFVQAQELAEQKGLELQEYRSEYNDHYPEGQIYLTAPPAGGAVSKDSPIVKAWVSKGPRFTSVPSVVGVRQNVAMERITDVRLVPKVDQEYSDSVEAGYVISQSPEAGSKLEPPKEVTIVVSKGPQAPPPVSGSEETEDQTGQNETDEPQPVANDEPRLINITVDVPQNGSETQTVQIVVSDSQADDQVVYEQVHNAGDSFTEQITGYGDRIRVRVLIDGRVQWRQTFTRRNQ